MPKDSDIANLLANLPNKKCRRCGCETEFGDFGDLSVLCSPCEKIESNEEDARELVDFDRNPFHYDIDKVLDGQEDHQVLAYFADTLAIPAPRLLSCEEVPVFIGRLSCDWRNGFYDMVVEGHHSILFSVLPSLARCGATRAAEAVAECLGVLERFGYRSLISDCEEPYSELSDSDRMALDEALQQLQSKWGTLISEDREMQASAYEWVVEHREDFRSRQFQKA